MRTQTQPVRRYKCRRSYCPNYYSDVIAKEGWTQRNALKGAECIPCLYAHQIAEQGQTIEQIETVPQLMQMFLSLLDKTGWTWQDVKDSLQRIQELPPEARKAAMLL